VTHIRPARESDLPQVFDIFYVHEVGDEPRPPPKGDVLPAFRHELTTGSMVVGDEGGRILGFATVMARGHTTYLSELFVRPVAQSSGLGTALLRWVFPPSTGGHVRFTVSSTDFRAVSLYIRAGLRPQWPNFLLQADAPAPERLPDTDVEVLEALLADRDMARWDAEIGGRPRAVDHEYWVHVEGGVPLWFGRGGEVLGYGYVRPGVRSLWHPNLTVVGPVGARKEADAVACVSAAVRWASARSQTICIDVPGPHPSLAPLLEARFRITYVETFLADGPLFDPRLYVGSGDWLL